MKEKALNRRLKVIMTFSLALLIATLIMALASGYMFARRYLWGYIPLIVAIIVIVPAIKHLIKLCDEQIRMSRKEQKGTDGEPTRSCTTKLQVHGVSI